MDERAGLLGLKLDCDECLEIATEVHICPEGEPHWFCERHSKGFMLEMVLRGYKSRGVTPGELGFDGL